jgi:hypothetical protein
LSAIIVVGAHDSSGEELDDEAILDRGIKEQKLGEILRSEPQLLESSKLNQF